MSVLGIDISSKSIDVVLLRDYAEPMLWTAKIDDKGDPGPEKSFRAARRAASAMRGKTFLSIVSRAAGAFIERPYSQGFRATSSLMRIQGVVVASLIHRFPDELHELPPQSWKQLIGLKANASKDDVMSWAHDQFDPWLPTSWSQDSIDALAIAEAGRVILRDRRAA